MPSTRIIASAALGCLFICGLFNNEGMAQTASADPVSKLIHFLHSGEPEAKKRAGSTAKNSSKAHPAAKKPSSTKPVSTSNRAQEVTVNEAPIDGETMRRFASPSDANDIDLAANAQATLESDAAAATVVNAVSPEAMAPADKSNSGASVVSQTPSSNSGSISWLLGVIAALGGATAIGLLAWFLIEPSASADVWAHLSEV